MFSNENEISNESNFNFYDKRNNTKYDAKDVDVRFIIP